MKLESAIVAFVFGVLELTGLVSSLCLVRSTDQPRAYWYQCSMSNDYFADVMTAPIDIPRLLFTNSKMDVIRNRSFTRLSDGLETLEIYFSEIGEIEDNAFEGLVKLTALEIEECNLQILKGAWLNGLPNLKLVSFRGNDIKHIECGFFSAVPPLRFLDISENDLSCIPVASLENFNTRVLHLKHNLLSWECIATLVDWLKKHKVHYDDFERSNWDSSAELVLECQDALRKTNVQLSEVNIQDCVEGRALQLLMSKRNFTVEQICRYLRRPTPFLNCFEQSQET